MDTSVPWDIRRWPNKEQNIPPNNLGFIGTVLNFGCCPAVPRILPHALISTVAASSGTVTVAYNSGEGSCQLPSPPFTLWPLLLATWCRRAWRSNTSLVNCRPRLVVLERIRCLNRTLAHYYTVGKGLVKPSRLFKNLCWRLKCCIFLSLSIAIVSSNLYK